MKLGKEQLRLLCGCASPYSALVLPDKVSRSLVKRGLFRENTGGSSCITPAGLRALADAMENGALPDGLTRIEPKAP